MSEFLSPAEAAEFLGIGADQLCEMVSRGICPGPVDLIDHLAYSRRGLIAWLERGCPIVDSAGYEMAVEADERRRLESLRTLKDDIKQARLRAGR